MSNWINYNEKLVRRAEILISGDILQNWDKELAEMNCKKRGRRFAYPNSFMKIVGYAKGLIWPTIPADRGLLRTYRNTIPKVPDYTEILKRVTWSIVISSQEVGSDYMVISIDST
jgi:hypothetical protein